MRKPTKARAITLATAMSLAFLPAGATVASAHSAAPYCGIRWGSLPEAARGLSPVAGPIHNIRLGRHDCFERVVIDISGSDPAGYRVEYVDAIVGTDDRRHDLRGGANLQIVVAAPSHTEGRGGRIVQTLRGMPALGGYKNVTDFRLVESFEGMSIIGIGTRGRLPFRVFIEEGGPGGKPGGHRLVIDVANRW